MTKESPKIQFITKKIEFSKKRQELLRIHGEYIKYIKNTVEYKNAITWAEYPYCQESEEDILRRVAMREENWVKFFNLPGCEDYWDIDFGGKLKLG